MSPAFTNAVYGLQVLFAVAGLVLLWRYVLSPAARQARTASPLPSWQPEPIEFLALLLLVLFGLFAFAAASGLVVKALGFRGDAATLVSGAAAQFGMLAGVAAFASRVPGFRRQHSLPGGAIIKSGVVTFIISLPILVATSQGWELLLKLFGVPAERQDLIRMFAEAKSPVQLSVLIGLAIVVAPLTEELVFRAGLFRFLLPRAPRFLALLIPAVIFASLHVNWSTREGFASFAPLLVLALLFSLAYERTGNIGTSIIAHSLFNLNTIVMIFAGLS